MLNFIGTYECKIDAKGRLTLPSALKKQLANVVDDGLVLKRSVFQNCVEIYPMQEWDKLMGKINRLNKFKKKNNDFVRKFTAGVKLIEADANSRILVPKDLSAFAELQKEVVLSSAGEMIEIWDKENYEKVLNDVDDFAELAEEVMGDQDDE
ncbi:MULTISPECIES: division/cell wall cluster transcriptional repressor MraZ [Psychroflexus]|uniref:Transcriptional regulator MraZ n=1 Tax=Psychroflexus halocasei TaxID=908615 RepID=A0A1H3XKE2_9FLAO|nr:MULTISPECIES: division/cell wall cluster transcriptional repressor MraZ [Psychroflexus]PJX23937.1 division/cell wall cluster transcriptional repressor MraZ [Psychroflexus sp. S27]SDZ99082.1 MraZ protein [Psychroflexus halocasei]